MTASDQEHSRSRSKRHVHNHRSSEDTRPLQSSHFMSSPPRIVRDILVRDIENPQSGDPEQNTFVIEPSTPTLEATLDNSLVSTTPLASVTALPLINDSCLDNCTLSVLSTTANISINTTQLLNTSSLLFNVSRISLPPLRTLDASQQIPPATVHFQQSPPTFVPPETPVTSSPPSDPSNGSKLGSVNQKVVGGVVGCLAGVALVLVAVLYLLHRRRHPNSPRQADRASSLASLTPHSGFLASVLHRHITPEHQTPSSTVSPEFVVISGRRTSSEKDLQESIGGESPTSLCHAPRLGSTAIHFRSLENARPVAQTSPSISPSPFQDPVGRSLAHNDGSSISRFREHEEDL